MSHQYDIVIIGSGPGGYTAAVRAAQLGYRVAIVERYPILGGTCTNVGCIPAKSLLDSSEHFYDATHKFAAHGIETGAVHLNFAQLMQRKRKVVKQNTDGLTYLMAKNKVQVVQGTGSFVSATRLRVTAADGVSELEATYFIIATGSKPTTIPGVALDKQRIITSTEVLSLPGQPASLVVIGGGVVGVELASVYARLGTKVTILEYTNSLISVMDAELGKALHRVLTKLGIEVRLGCQMQSATNLGAAVTLTYLDSAQASQQLTAQYCLVAVGRRAYTVGLNLAAVGIATKSNGKIVVNEHLQTAVPTIYAIGDVIDGPMLAHKSEDEGVAVAERINGQKPHLRYELLPNVVYTWPEVAAVGATEQQLQAQGTPYQVGRFPFGASGRARASGDTDGFTKVLVGTTYGEVLGVHIIGPRAADLIAQAVVAMEYEVTAREMSHISYAHPTYAEALKEAYLQASGQGSLNM